LAKHGVAAVLGQTYRSQQCIVEPQLASTGADLSTAEGTTPTGGAKLYMQPEAVTLAVNTVRVH
jgi:hypothetical protein